MELSRNKPLIHSVPSGCTANCVYECIPGCPPACCTKTESPEVSRYTYYQQPETQLYSPEMFSFPQPIMPPYVEQPQMYPQEQTQPMYTDEDQTATKNEQSTSMDTDTNADSPSQNFAPKHCPSSCLTHCSPLCVRSDCCDLDK